MRRKVEEEIKRWTEGNAERIHEKEMEFVGKVGEVIEEMIMRCETGLVEEARTRPPSLQAETLIMLW